MTIGAFTNYIDITQLTLYVFWGFFLALVLWLHREGKREGYPLDSDRKGVLVQGFPAMPAPKTFILPNGELRLAPRYEPPQPVLGAVPAFGFVGAPLTPTGNPLVDGVGPASYANRPDHHELTWGDGLDKLVPLRVAREFSISDEDPDPRGMELIGADGMTAGTVSEVWVDRSEMHFRYLELTLLDGSRTVMVPLTYVQFLARRRLKVRAIRADQFADVPALKNPDLITMLEEDKIMGYFGGGQLYALPGRLGPIL